MRYLRSRPFVISLIIVGAFAVMLLDIQGRLRPVTNTVQSMLAPIAATFSDVRESASDLIRTARDLGSLRQRNNELEALVGRLTVENLQLSEVATENTQLRSLLLFAQTNPTYDFRGGQVIARVIGDSASAYADVIQIDLGKRHGIAPGMPVVTDRGLVGRVTDVRETTSSALLITDVSSSINALTQSSRAPGLVRGRPGQGLQLDLVPPDLELAVGDIVMTSGLGGNFPKGLVIGQITNVQQSDQQIFQQAALQPTVDFDRLELVLVITNFTPVDELEMTGDATTLTPTPPTP